MDADQCVEFSGSPTTAGAKPINVSVEATEVIKNKNNFEVLQMLDFIEAIIQHIPEQAFRLVRYYGCCSNGTRCNRNKREQAKVKAEFFFHQLLAPHF